MEVAKAVEGGKGCGKGYTRKEYATGCRKGRGRFKRPKKVGKVVTYAASSFFFGRGVAWSVARILLAGCRSEAGIE